MNKMNKTIEAIVLIGALGLAGCESKSGHLYKAQQNATPTTVSVDNNAPAYTFNDFGHLRTPKQKYGLDDASITSADFDGDGDMDIAIVRSSGAMFIYENKMPQKNKQ
jgi:hypothetical protein